MWALAVEGALSVDTFTIVQAGICLIQTLIHIHFTELSRPSCIAIHTLEPIKDVVASSAIQTRDLQTFITIFLTVLSLPEFRTLTSVRAICVDTETFMLTRVPLTFVSVVPTI